MLERSPAAAESPGPPGERSMDGTGRTPPTHLLVRDSSTYSLSDAGSHSRSVFTHWLCERQEELDCLCKTRSSTLSF